MMVTQTYEIDEDGIYRLVATDPPNFRMTVIGNELVVTAYEDNRILSRVPWPVPPSEPGTSEPHDVGSSGDCSGPDQAARFARSSCISGR